MIIGIGTDIVDIRRIERLVQNNKFVARCFTAAEQSYAMSKTDEHIRIGIYAKRFAAKEACAKALGCGIGADVGLLEIECLNDDRGAPYLTLSGAAEKRLRWLCPEKMTSFVHISLSDEPPYAVAYVVLSANV